MIDAASRGNDLPASRWNERGIASVARKKEKTLPSLNNRECSDAHLFPRILFVLFRRASARVILPSLLERESPSARARERGREREKEKGTEGQRERGAADEPGGPNRTC